MPIVTYYLQVIGEKKGDIYLLDLIYIHDPNFLFDVTCDKCMRSSVFFLIFLFL